MGFEGNLYQAKFPKVQKSALQKNELSIVVQVNGKKRGQVNIPAALEEKELVNRAIALPSVATLLTEKQLVKHIYIPGRLLNLVLK